MEERLSKLLALAGLASRREADRLVREGHVTVNGTLVTEPAERVDLERDHIKVDGRLVTQLPGNSYLLLNKPRAVLATRSEDEDRPSVVSLLKGVKGRMIPVGKLDWDDEGLMLLTNDGTLALALLDPKAGVPRTYLVKVRGVPDDRTLARLRTGVPYEGGRSLPMEARIVSVTNRNAWLQLTVREARSNLLKKVLQKLRHPVVKLKRTGFGPLSIKGLAPGTFRKLVEDEVKKLRELATNPPGLPEPVYATEEAAADAEPERRPIKRRTTPTRQTRAARGEDTGAPQRPARGSRGGDASSAPRPARGPSAGESSSGPRPARGPSAGESSSGPRPAPGARGVESSTSRPARGARSAGGTSPKGGPGRSTPRGGSRSG